MSVTYEIGKIPPSTKAQKARFAEMLRLRQPPRCMTDGVLWSDRGTLDKQFKGEEHMLEKLVKISKKNGYKPNYNDAYVSTLARYPGDPQGFVSTGSDGRSQVAARLRDRGTCDENGNVNVQAAKYVTSEEIKAIKVKKIREKKGLK